MSENAEMVLLVTRMVDDERVRYEVFVPRRRLVDMMRIENMKPGRVVSAVPVQP